jgi:hypothetical protein
LIWTVGAGTGAIELVLKSTECMMSEIADGAIVGATRMWSVTP